jgi:hypothetical protein
METRYVTYQPEYKGLSILGSDGYGSHPEILETLLQLFNQAITAHNKIIFMRFDVRLPQFGVYPQDNSLIRQFTADFMKYLKRASLDPRYLWAREQKSSERPHWHYCVLFKGCEFRDFVKLLKKAEEIWSRKLEFGDLREGAGLIDFCRRDKNGFPQQNGMMIRRGDSDMFNRCFEWGSYLAKVSQKEMNQGVRSYGCSRLGGWRNAS